MSNTLLGQPLNMKRSGDGAGNHPGEGSLITAGEYANHLEPFLGPPTKAIDYEPSFRFPHEAWFLPDAYQGRNDYVRETIVQTVVNYNSFMTSEILPWKYQENPNIAWDSIKFDKTLVDLEPEQGVPRYVTVEREAHTDYMVRRGLALLVNHGFAATPGGQKDFMYKVATIAGAVQETCDQAGLLALLRSKNEYRSHIIDHIRNAADAYDMFSHEIWRFGIIQHSERGWYHMDAEAENVMQLENIQPDCWIVPNRMTSYAAMGQHAETEVYRAGEKVARGNLEQGKDRFTTFRGKKVYETRPYQLDVDGRVVDPLNRTRMIGDFFVVPYHEMMNFNGRIYPQARKGTTQVYCCESDRFESFVWEDVVKASKFDSVSQELFDGFAAGNPFSNQNASDPRKFLAAVAMHTALIRNNHTAADEIERVVLDPTNASDEAREEARRYLPDFLKKFITPNHDETLTAVRTQASASRAPAAASSSPATTAAMKKAVELAVEKKHGVQMSSVPHCASTWGGAISQAGFDDAITHAAMSRALHESVENYIYNCAEESPEELEANLHVNPDGSRRSMLEVAEDLQAGYLDTAEGGSFDDCLEAAQAAATEYATQMMSGRSGAGAMHHQGTIVGNELGYEPAAIPSGFTHEEGSYDLLCVRPFREYTMGTGILLKKGSELGNTFRGWADFQLTDNIIAKTHIGHFTFWHASIVTNPKCLFLAEDIFCSNYIRGEGRGVLSWEHISEFQQDPVGTMAKYNASIIALPVPTGALNATDKRLQMNNPISLAGVLDPVTRGSTGRTQATSVNIGDYEVEGKTGRCIDELESMWDTWIDAAAATPDPATGAGNRTMLARDNPKPYYNNLHRKTGQVYSDMYAALFGFHEMNHDVDYENSTTFETAARIINTMCFHTMQKFKNPLNNRWEVTNLNTGHFGENGIYEGVKRIRCGFLDYFKEMDYQKAMSMGGLTI